jgi:hypothetical protein
MEKVWLYDMEEDGYIWMIKDSDRRKGNIPDIIERFRSAKKKIWMKGRFWKILLN